MEHDKLIEKHARALGLTDVKVSWATFAGANAMNDALISGSVDIVSGGITGLLALWARTRGTPQEVRGVAALSSHPVLLNTRNPEVKTIADLKESDQIALPAVKISLNAVVLQMAAAKMFGEKNFAKLDPLTVTMASPDATIALMNGTVTCAFSFPPFQEQQLEQSGIRTILHSYEVLEGSHTAVAAWTSARFRDRNPMLYQALIVAIREATEIVNNDRRAAAALWIKDANSKLPLEKVYQVVSNPQFKVTMVPEKTMKFANFMHSVGTLRAAPGSWRDLFFPEFNDPDGS